MTGRVYLLRGEPVELVCRFTLPSQRNPAAPCPPWLRWVTPPPGAPRNAAVRYRDGHVEVRPFRGLRRSPSPAPAPAGARPRPGTAAARAARTQAEGTAPAT